MKNLQFEFLNDSFGYCFFPRESVYLGYVSSLTWIAVFLVLCWVVIKVKAI